MLREGSAVCQADSAHWVVEALTEAVAARFELPQLFDAHWRELIRQAVVFLSLSHFGAPFVALAALPLEGQAFCFRESDL